MSVLIERQIKSRLDMAEIEEKIIEALGGENHRCSFLRSNAYMQVRVNALYHVDPEPMSVFSENLCVTLSKGPENQKLVSVRLVHDFSYDPSWKNDSTCEPETGDVGQDKRRKLKE